MKKIFALLTWFFDRLYWRIRLELLGKPNCKLDRFFDNKRVIIVGPASGVVEDARNINIDDYDTIIRMNNGVMHSAGFNGALGSRTDLWIHNFRFGGERSAGGISSSLISDNNVKCIVYPTLTAATLKLFLSHFCELKRKIKSVDVSYFPPSEYRSLCKEFYPYSPTIGSIIINHVLSKDFDELCIIGMSLFKTAYQNEYNEKANDVTKTRKWVEEGGVHNPDYEFGITSRAILEAIESGKNVVLGKDLQMVLGASKTD